MDYFWLGFEKQALKKKSKKNTIDEWIGDSKKHQKVLDVVKEKQVESLNVCPRIESQNTGDFYDRSNPW